MEIAHYLPGVTPQGELVVATSLLAKKEVVYTKYFQKPSCSISLRSFCIVRDMPVVQNWAWKLDRAAKIVAASYLYTGASDFARSFMVLANNRKPVCQIDICDAAKDELYELYRACNGDYIVRFLFNTNKKHLHAFHIKAMQTCIEYFFSFSEVKQLIAVPEAGNRLYNELLLKLGFRFREKIYNQYSVSNLYAYSKEELQNQ